MGAEKATGIRRSLLIPADKARLPMSNSPDLLLRHWQIPAAVSQTDARNNRSDTTDLFYQDAMSNE